MDTTSHKFVVAESNSNDISVHIQVEVQLQLRDMELRDILDIVEGDILDIDEHFGSKLLLPKLFHRVELGLLLPKHQVTLKIKL